MPNCQWFATIDDHAALLGEVFEWGAVDVWELSSRPNQPLRQFQSPAEVLAEFDRPDLVRSFVHLLLWVRGAGPGLSKRRVNVTTGPLQGTWIEHADHTGCLSFYLEAFRSGQRLELSSTNTSSLASFPDAVNGVVTEPGGVTWDIGLCNRTSSALNRKIRKRAVAKIGSASVLPGALDLWEGGEQLYAWDKARNAAEMVRR